MCTRETTGKVLTRDGIINVLKTEVTTNRGVRVSITSKVCGDGQNRYAVILKNRATGARTRLRTYNRVLDAWNLYKTIRTM